MIASILEGVVALYVLISIDMISTHLFSAPSSRFSATTYNIARYIGTYLNYPMVFVSVNSSLEEVWAMLVFPWSDTGGRGTIAAGGQRIIHKDQPCKLKAYSPCCLYDSGKSGWSYINANQELNNREERAAEIRPKT